MTYIPLHVHSDKDSLLDSIATIDNIEKRLKKIEVPACAITGHGSLSNGIEFLKMTKGLKIQPILGVEFYVCPLQSEIKDETNRSYSHTLLLAKNDKGYQNLCKLLTRANQAFYYKPRLSLEEIAEYSDNLIAISGHLGSTIASQIVQNDKFNVYWKKDGIKIAEKFREIFGESFFLEVQRIDAKQKVSQKLSEYIRDLAAHLKIKTVATPDAHYCERADAADQRIVLAMNMGTTVDKLRESGKFGAFLDGDSYHIPSYEEMKECHTEEELKNTLLVKDMCQPYEHILKQPMLPEIPCPKGYNADEWLRQLCREGWRKKIIPKVDEADFPRYVERIKYELGVIQSVECSGRSLSNYFLMVHDILNFATQNKWLLGPGRGSAAGCLVSHLLNITNIDPIKHGLIFERFYNAGRNTKDRVSLPDIDMDVPKFARKDIIDYIKKTYGADRVGQMIAFQTIKARGALKNVLKSNDVLEFEERNKITKLFPEEHKIAGELKAMEEDTGDSSIIQYALENRADKFAEWCRIKDGKLEGPLAAQFAQAIRLEGVAIAQSKHPAGIVVAPEPLENICPMVWDTKEKQLIAGLEMEPAESCGLVKLDVLGLSTLDRITTIQELLLEK